MRIQTLTIPVALFAVFVFACSGSSSGSDDEGDVTTIDLSFSQDPSDDSTVSDGGDSTEPDVVVPDSIDDGAEDLGGSDESDISEDTGNDSDVGECVPDCSELECGPDPICGEECGPCDSSAPACNDGTCEAVCDDELCGNQTFCSRWLCLPDCSEDECTQAELCSYDGIEVRSCSNYTCRDDESCAATEERQVRGACTRETDDDVVSDVTEGDCLNDDICADTGVSISTAIVCDDGAHRGGSRSRQQRVRPGSRGGCSAWDRAR